MRAEKVCFHCSYCDLIFVSQTETTWEQAKAGEHWFTAQGYIAKCPRCASYADEFGVPCGKTRIREPHKEYTGLGILVKATRGEMAPAALEDIMGKMYAEEKEKLTMKVSYNGFAGELVKLERTQTERYTLTPYDNDRHPIFAYVL